MSDKQIKISRYTGIGEVPRKTWKDLIASLVLSGYKVYGDEESISFVLGDDDEIIGS